MAKKFFLRNDPETIKNAASMTKADFIKHYSDTMSSSDALGKAYDEMNKKVKANQPGGARDAKTKNNEPITNDADLEKKNPLVDIENVTLHDDGDRSISGTVKGTNIKISHTVEGSKLSLKEQMALAGGEEEAPTGKNKKAGKTAKPKKEKDPNAPKKEGGFVKTEEGTKRDARIIELLGKKMPVAKILETMTAEGIKVFGPQIYKVKKELEAAKK